MICDQLTRAFTSLLIAFSLVFAGCGKEADTAKSPQPEATDSDPATSTGQQNSTVQQESSQAKPTETGSSDKRATSSNRAVAEQPERDPGLQTPPPSSAVEPQANETHLRELEPKITGVLAREDLKFDRSFTVQGVTYENGVFIHPRTNSTGRATYTLNDSYKRMTGRVGVSDHYLLESSTALIFRVLGDGKELWASRQLHLCGDWVAFDVDLSNVKELSLEVICDGENTGAWGGWMDPMLISKP